MSRTLTNNLRQRLSAGQTVGNEEAHAVTVVVVKRFAAEAARTAVRDWSLKYFLKMSKNN